MAPAKSTSSCKRTAAEDARIGYQLERFERGIGDRDDGQRVTQRVEQNWPVFGGVEYCRAIKGEHVVHDEQRGPRPKGYQPVLLPGFARLTTGTAPMLKPRRCFGCRRIRLRVVVRRPPGAWQSLRGGWLAVHRATPPANARRENREPSPRVARCPGRVRQRRYHRPGRPLIYPFRLPEATPRPP